MILKTMMQPNRTLYRGAGIYIMDGNDFYYEAGTSVNVLPQEQIKANDIITPVLASLYRKRRNPYSKDSKS